MKDDVTLNHLRLEAFLLQGAMGGVGMATEYNPNYNFGGVNCTLRDLREIPREQLPLVKEVEGASGREGLRCCCLSLSCPFTSKREPQEGRGPDACCCPSLSCPFTSKKEPQGGSDSDVCCRPSLSCPFTSKREPQRGRDSDICCCPSLSCPFTSIQDQLTII